VNFPKFNKKWELQSKVTAKKSVEHRTDIGRTTSFEVPLDLVLTFQNSVIEHVDRTYYSKKPVTDSSSVSYREVLTGDKKVGVLKCSIGAPAAAVALEEYFWRGARRIVLLGTAGALDSKLEPGDVVVCERALRDEGTSCHYIDPKTKSMVASPNLQRYLIEGLEKDRVKFFEGGTWSIDAPFRETWEECDFYRDEGYLTVEMEAAAVFAFARHYGLEAAAVFVISDTLAGSWTPDFANPRKKGSLRRMTEFVINMLARN